MISLVEQLKAEEEKMERQERYFTMPVELLRNFINKKRLKIQTLEAATKENQAAWWEAAVDLNFLEEILQSKRAQGKQGNTP